MDPLTADISNFKAPRRAKFAPEPVNVMDQISAAISSINPPMRLIKVHQDMCQATLECPRGHSHSYYIADIMQSSGSCKTCALGKIAAIFLQVANELLGPGFVLCDRRLKEIKSTHEFANIRLKLVLEFGRGIAQPTAYKMGEMLVLEVPHAAKKRTILRTLRSLLRGHDGYLPAKPPPAHRFEQDPLPYSPDMVELIVHGKHNKLLFQMQLNIVNDPGLCIENCV